jgi:hypothetical protein
VRRTYNARSPPVSSDDRRFMTKNAALNISYKMTCYVDDEVHHTHQTARQIYINLFNNSPHKWVMSLVSNSIPKAVCASWVVLNE